MNSPAFLRRVLALDAASCAMIGLLLSLDSAALAPLFGLGETLLFGAGLLLLPLAAFIAWLASRPAPPSPLVWLVIVGNVAWTAESFLLISTEGGRITALGTAFVAAARPSRSSPSRFWNMPACAGCGRPRLSADSRLRSG